MTIAPGRIFSVVIRLAAVAAVAGFVVYLGAAALAPRGEIAMATDLTRPAPFISEPKPSERLDLESADAAGPVRLVGSPLYLDVTPPADFDRVTMKVRYANASGATIELGAKTSGLDNQFEMRPAEMRLIDALNWHRTASGRLTLLERRHEYASIDEFLDHSPAAERTAVWLAAVPAPYRLADYSPSNRTREINVSLRGRHRLWTYVKGEPLNFAFTVQDMNRVEGADPVVVSVYSGGSDAPLAMTVLKDDGDVSADQRSSGLRTVAVSLTAPPEGAYQIEFTAPDDIFIRRLTTRQSKLVFAERLYLGDQVGYSDQVTPAAVFVRGGRLSGRTAHAEGTQTIDVGGAPLEVGEPNVPVSRRLPASDSPLPVVSPLQDVLLETDGWFAFSREEMFAPAPWPIGWATTAADLDARGIDYILTTYEPPAAEGRYLEASAQFETDRLVRTAEGAYRFVISAPGVDGSNDDIRLASVSFVWSRDAAGWRDAWHRLVRMFAAGGAGSERVAPFGRSFGEDPL